MNAKTFLRDALAPDEHTFADAERALASIEWDWLFERARAHKVHGLLVSHMDRANLTETCPEPAHRLLESARADVHAKAERAARTFREALPPLEALGIPYVVLKGPVLSQHVYEDEHARPYGDLDLVIPRARLEEAARALEGIGYFFWAPPFIHRIARKRRGLAPESTIRIPIDELRDAGRSTHHHEILVTRRDDPRNPVELHWALARSGVIAGDPDVAWEETMEIELFGRRVQTLTPEATLVYVAVHAMEQSLKSFKLLHLADVWWILARWRDRIDPARLDRLATNWGVERHLVGAIEAVRANFPRAGGDLRAYPHRNRWMRACFEVVRRHADLLDDPRPPNRWKRLHCRVTRETMWDAAFLRPPRRVLRTTAVALAGRLRRAARETVVPRES